MDLSVIIVNWNVCDLLRQCLRSLYRDVQGLSFEVIVVDNASTDGSLAMLAAEFPDVRVIANDGNAGFCKANNQGLETAKGDFLVLLNPDTEVHPGALETLVAFLREHPDTGIVGPRLIDGSGKELLNGRRFPTVVRELLGITSLSGLNPPAYQRMCYGREDFSSLAEVDEVCGCCLLFRREVYEQIGGLDEDLFMFFDEVDFAHRAKSRGWRVFFVPAATIVHYWMGSVSQVPIQACVRIFRSQYIYFRKHHGLLPALLLRSFSAWTVAYRTSRIRLGRLRRRVMGMPLP